jgi:hypothetical protein
VPLERFASWFLLVDCDGHADGGDHWSGFSGRYFGSTGKPFQNLRATSYSIEVSIIYDFGKTKYPAESLGIGVGRLLNSAAHSGPGSIVGNERKKR